MSISLSLRFQKSLISPNFSEKNVLFLEKMGFPFRKNGTFSLEKWSFPLVNVGQAKEVEEPN
jgi:hypothetical protein